LRGSRTVETGFLFAISAFNASLGIGGAEAEAAGAAPGLVCCNIANDRGTAMDANMPWVDGPSSASHIGPFIGGNGSTETSRSAPIIFVCRAAL
jgi:hypothetical protein